MRFAEEGGTELTVADLDLAAICFARDGRVDLAEAVALRVEEPSMRMLYALADMARTGGPSPPQTTLEHHRRETCFLQRGG